MTFFFLIHIDPLPVHFADSSFLLQRVTRREKQWLEELALLFKDGIFSQFYQVALKTCLQMNNVGGYVFQK